MNVRKFQTLWICKHSINTCEFGIRIVRVKLQTSWRHKILRLYTWWTKDIIFISYTELTLNIYFKKNKAKL